MNTNFLTGPISKKYCLYFYFLTLFSGISLVILAVVAIYGLFKTKLNMNTILNTVIMLIYGFLTYLTNRLLYNMCINSI